jgi:hypothetical protein
LESFQSVLRHHRRAIPTRTGRGSSSAIGKEISGTGMDSSVIARHDVRGIENPRRPFITRIAGLGATDATAGNAIALGMADLTTRVVAR